LDRPLDAHLFPGEMDGIYYFAPPPNRGERDTRMTHFLEALKNCPTKKIVYISTTGVYGDCQGRWIDEEEPTKPITDRGKRRLDAEIQLSQWAENAKVGLTILRVPGIYGPGRLPVERITRRIPVVRLDEAPYSNRIHADDLAAISCQAMQINTSYTVFNVSDGNPTSMTDYFLTVADHLGLERPPEISMEEARKQFSPEILSFLDESKRIQNERVLNDLNIELQFPNLETGIKHCS
jgi:nucleoside-diphosphate-sugar epimerase